MKINFYKFSVEKEIIILFMILSIIVFLSHFSLFFIPFSLSEPVIIEIKKGTPFFKAIKLLSDKKLIFNDNIIIFIGKLTKFDKKIKYGFYNFNGKVSQYKILKDILVGNVAFKEVTIPEGFNLWQIAERFQKVGLIEKEEFLKIAYDKKILQQLKINAPSAEGYIFPDTYKFPIGIKAEHILKIMVKNMRKHFNENLRIRMQQLGMTEREVLTLASMIEKEAKIDEERYLISAVFHNRLKKGIPLESDPTAIYGIKDLSKGITKADLKIVNPYNTYLIKGLPPGPIASAGMKSIIAALYPADVPYLFFVSMNNGKHYFSSTVSEHLKAVKKFRKS